MATMNGFKLNDFSTDQDPHKSLEFGGHQLKLSQFGINYLGDSDIFSDIDLRFIDRILNEEDIDENLEMFHGHTALAATEKPFYEILGEKYPPSPDRPPLYSNPSPETPETPKDSNWVVNGGWGDDAPEFSPLPQSYYSSQSSIFSKNAYEGLENPNVSKAAGFDLFDESFHAWQFIRGAEEARKFLPRQENLAIDSGVYRVSLPQKPVVEEEGYGLVEIKLEIEERDDQNLGYESRGRKNRHSDEYLEEERCNKQSAIDYSEETLRSEMSDLVLLCPSNRGADGKDSASSHGGGMKNEAIRSSLNGNSGSGNGRARKMQSMSEGVDLRALLNHCAQAVAANDRRIANELLRQIRQHASPFGDGTQRVAVYFANALEARMAGTGSEKYRSLEAKPVSSTDILKAYQLYMTACPFRKLSHFFSNQMILNATKNASRVHILDFGIYYGFQWPSFIQRLAHRLGGPPKLRITGIEIPQPGFRPAERTKETGRRIAEYARDFNVPFEYHAIAAKWETIRIEDLRLDKEEVLVVNCLFRLKNLADESVAGVNCPRNKVLNMIREIKPAIFVEGIVNGSYSAPFFVTRFREALFHFSALFDMLENNTTRENAQRLFIERSIFGQDALNVVACEGSERVERPETYKQWQVRNLRAGFVQLPLDRDILKKGKERVKTFHHKDFDIDEDNQWLLQGWKGRIVYALSAWRPNCVG